mgnify:CR=1 FL=1
MPLHDPVISCKSRSSYGAHVLDHLAADGAGFAGGQVAVVAVLQVDADLPWCSFSSYFLRVPDWMAAGSFARGLGPARRRSGKRCGCSGETAAPGGRTSGYPAAIPSVRSQCAQQTATAFLCPASQCVYSAVQGRKNADNPPLRFLFCPVPMLSEVFEVPRPQFELRHHIG